MRIVAARWLAIILGLVVLAACTAQVPSSPSDIVNAAPSTPPGVDENCGALSNLIVYGANPALPTKGQLPTKIQLQCANGISVTIRPPYGNMDLEVPGITVYAVLIVAGETRVFYYFGSDRTNCVAVLSDSPSTSTTRHLGACA